MILVKIVILKSKIVCKDKKNMNRKNELKDVEKKESNLLYYFAVLFNYVFRFSIK